MASIPPIKVIEQFSLGKSGTLADSEDLLVVTPSFVGVIDGATSRTQTRWSNLTTGQMAARLVREAIEGLTPEATKPQAAAAMTAAIRNFYVGRDLVHAVSTDPAERLTASVALFSSSRREVWLIGDCFCRVDDKTFACPNAIDDVLARVRALYLELELFSGSSTQQLIESDPGRAYVWPLVEREQLLQNARTAQPFSYAVVDGFQIPLAKTRTVRVPASAREVVLASDGYPQVLADLQSSEAYLARLLREDPLLIRRYRAVRGLVPGNTSYDDRSYVRINVAREGVAIKPTATKRR